MALEEPAVRTAAAEVEGAWTAAEAAAAGREEEAREEEAREEAAREEVARGEAAMVAVAREGRWAARWVESGVVLKEAAEAAATAGPRAD